MTSFTHSIKVFLVFFSFLALNSITFAQGKENYVHTNELDPNSEDNKGLFNSQLEKLTGTFQFVITKENYSVLLSKDLLNQVEGERMLDQNAIIIIDEFTTLFIPSENKINSSTFIALPMVKYDLTGTVLNNINEEN